MDRSASWWDCGEFIATSYGLQVGHPPGAPLYQLVARCFMLLSFGHPMWMAPLANAVSALCGAFTSLLLYNTILELGGRIRMKNEELRVKNSAAADNSSFLIPHSSLILRAGAMCGALCYTFCDTAWFSAVESEVYSMAMLFCALTVWLILVWERSGNHRLLLLEALIVGLGVCVHLMTLLTLPFLLWVMVRRMKNEELRIKNSAAACGAMLIFFAIGLTPYAIVPIRAAANPPINEGNPDNYERFVQYVKRDQYPKAPLYPRMWREQDEANWDQWVPGGADPESLWDNVVYYAGYQFGFMYCRYVMYNFIGRWNNHWDIVVVSLLPFLLGLWGLVAHWRRRRGDFRALLLLFLFGGIILNIYLNHPCYEPRARDYAYVLSFYAFAVWIGLGAGEVLGIKNEELRMKNSAAAKHSRKQILHSSFFILHFSLVMRVVVIAAPLLLAVGNWSDHDRHNCHSVHDISLNHLQSCDHGAILISYGDNDTFPLWYLQQVEKRRTDVTLYNVNLTGYAFVWNLLSQNGIVPNGYLSRLGEEERRPVYLTQYAYDKLEPYFRGRLRCEGYCWRVLPTSVGTNDPRPLQRHIQDSIRWNITPHEYVNNTSKSLLEIWKRNTSSL